MYNYKICPIFTNEHITIRLYEMRFIHNVYIYAYIRVYMFSCKEDFYYIELSKLLLGLFYVYVCVCAQRKDNILSWSNIKTL